MAKFEKIVHTALDELRMQMLGTQVSFGFQLQGSFRERFARLSPIAHIADAAALALLVLTLALLVLTLALLLAPLCQHRLVEAGNASKRLLAVAGRFAGAALVPYTVAIGCDVYVVGETYWGSFLALAAGALAVLAGLGLWYALGAVLRLIVPPSEREPRMPPQSRTSLHEKIGQMLTEARVILPGAQAFLGFQLVVMMSQTFAGLPSFERTLHFAAFWRSRCR